jgi:hypothetical protein
MKLVGYCSKSSFYGTFLSGSEFLYEQNVEICCWSHNQIFINYGYLHYIYYTMTEEAKLFIRL